MKKMKVIIGDNPFFGVNHSKSIGKLDKSEDRFLNAAEVMETAIKNGATTMMLSNHKSCTDLLNVFEKQSVKNYDLAFVIPYPHTYNDIIAEGGYLAIIKYLIKGNLLNISLTALKFIFKGRYGKNLMRALINAELNSLQKYKNKVSYLCLHNIFVDMFIAGGNYGLLNDFIDSCLEKSLEPVLITQNPISLINGLNRKDFTACFSFNQLGYMVNPSLNNTINILASRAEDLPSIWAMQILASGAGDPNKCLDFINQFNLFSGILYASTKPKRVANFIASSKVS